MSCMQEVVVQQTFFIGGWQMDGWRWMVVRRSVRRLYPKDRNVAEHDHDPRRDDALSFCTINIFRTQPARFFLYRSLRRMDLEGYVSFSYDINVSFGQNIHK